MARPAAAALLLLLLLGAARAHDHNRAVPPRSLEELYAKHFASVAAPAAAAQCVQPDDFSISLAQAPGAPPATTTTKLTFRIWNHQLDRAVTWRELALTHDRVAHIVLASSSADVFGHLHTEDFAPKPANLDTAVELAVHFDLSRAPAWVAKVEAAIKVHRICDVSDKDGARITKRHVVGDSLARRHTDSDDDGNGDDDGQVLVVAKEFALSFTASDLAKPMDLPVESTSIMFHGLRMSPTRQAFVHPVRFSDIEALPDSSEGAHSLDDMLAAQPSSSSSSVAAVTPFKSGLVYLATIPDLVSTRQFQRNECHTLLIHFARYLRTKRSFAPLTTLNPYLLTSTHITAMRRFDAAGRDARLKIVHIHGSLVAETSVPVALQTRTRESMARHAHLHRLEDHAMELERDAGESRDPVPLPPTLDMCRNMPHHHHHHHAQGSGGMANAFGPWIAFPLNLPESGWWRIVVQARHGDLMLAPSFWVFVD